LVVSSFEVLYATKSKGYQRSCIYWASLFHGTDRTGRTQTLIHGTYRNGVERMREAAGLLRLLSQPWLAQHESPVESPVESLTTWVAVYQPRTEKVRDQP